MRFPLNLPNSLTFSRIFLVPILVVVLLTRFAGKEILAVIIFLVAMATDWADGYLARKRNEVSDLGKLLDPMADKILMSAAFIAMVEENLAPAWIVVTIVAREFAVSTLRSFASSRGITIAASPLGKAKTVSQTIAVPLLILGSNILGPYEIIARLALYAVLILALASAAHYFVKFTRQLGIGWSG